MSSPTQLSALTLYPEWIYAMGYLGKRIENRSEHVAARARNLVGRWIALHGGAAIGGVTHPKDGSFSEAHRSAILDMLHVAHNAGFRTPAPGELTIGDLLARGQGIAIVARLVDVERPRPFTSGYLMAGCWGLRFDEMQLLDKPVPCSGERGFWEVPTDLLAQIRQRLPPDAPANLRALLRAA